MEIKYDPILGTLRESDVIKDAVKSTTVQNIVPLSRAEYDSLLVKDTNTLYLII